MSSETEHASRPKWKRALVWVVLSLAVVVLIAIVGSLVIRDAGRKRRDAALERIRARGEPLTLADAIAPPSGEGEDPLEWLKSFEDLPEVEIDIRGIAECAGIVEPGSDDAELLARLEAEWLDVTRIDRPTPCEVAVLHRIVELDVVRRAREIDRHRSVDWTRVLGGGMSDETLVVQVPWSGVINVIEALTHAALEAAARGDSDESLRCLELAQRGAELFEDSPVLIGNTCWLACESKVCRAIARVSSILPHGASVDSLYTTLASIEPRALLRRALLGERAYGERAFAVVGDGTEHLDAFDHMTGLGGLIRRTWLEDDEADYLEEMERALQTAAAPHALGGVVNRPSSFRNFVSVMLLPYWSQSIEATADLEARLLTTRAALIAHRDGLDAARTWAAAQRDPFVDHPLHTRIDTDGALSIWSVGKNLVDDGGPLPNWDEIHRSGEGTRDIVVRCPPR